MAKVPFEFVLEELEGLEVRTRPMFGCLSIYVADKIVLIQRQKDSHDDGLWLATTPEHHASLKRLFPNMRSITVFGPGETGWQVLPANSEDFESAALKACELIRKGDPRIGKVPKPRPLRRKKKKARSHR